MAEIDPLLAPAERVAQEAEALGIRTALIGAAALARHGYVRSTVDLDLGMTMTVDHRQSAVPALRAPRFELL